MTGPDPYLRPGPYLPLIVAFPPRQHIYTRIRTLSRILPLSAAAHAMLVSLTVGKVDAGVAVLLTEDKRLVRATCPTARIPTRASL